VPSPLPPAAIYKTRVGRKVVPTFSGSPRLAVRARVSNDRLVTSLPYKYGRCKIKSTITLREARRPRRLAPVRPMGSLYGYNLLTGFFIIYPRYGIDQPESC